VVPPRGDDRLHPLLLELLAQGIAVEGPIGDQPLGALAGPPLGLGGGRCTRIFSQCSSVKCLQAMPPVYSGLAEVLK
jgi:hypothetical protein